jgi:hypothetical protein
MGDLSVRADARFHVGWMLPLRQRKAVSAQRFADQLGAKVRVFPYDVIWRHSC